MATQQDPVLFFGFDFSCEITLERVGECSVEKIYHSELLMYPSKSRGAISMPNMHENFVATHTNEADMPCNA